MKTTLLTIAAVAALTIGAGSAGAMTAAPGAEIGPQVSTDQGVEPASHVYWRYREFWRGNCKYKTIYVSDGYRWAYRYVYRCY